MRELVPKQSCVLAQLPQMRIVASNAIVMLFPFTILIEFLQFFRALRTNVFLFSDIFRPIL